jgi:hypothetical protein
MSMRTSCLFRVGAVRRLPMLEGSWELESTSDLGTLEALESSTTMVDKSNGRLFRGYTTYSVNLFVETEPFQTYRSNSLHSPRCYSTEGRAYEAN